MNLFRHAFDCLASRCARLLTTLPIHPGDGPGTGAPRSAATAWSRTLTLIGALGAASVGHGAPPESEVTVVGSYAGRSRSDSAEVDGKVDSTATCSVTWLVRRRLLGEAWYGSTGLMAENNSFAGARGVPSRLQSYAVPVRLGYYRGDEPVAELSLSPGFYFEEHFSAKSWDVPVQLVSGLPVSESVHGVVGLANGRFFHHPLPICGVLWEQNKCWRWECVFPQPAIVFSPDAQSEWRLGGELAGNGYLGDAHPNRTVIEYSCYRVGLEYRWIGTSGPRWSLGGGMQVENRFDFFRAGRESNGKPTFYLKTGITLGR